MISLKRLLYEYTDEQSQLDPSVKVIVTRKGDGFYSKISHMFSKHGEGFLDLDTRTIFIDGEEADNEGWTEDHYLFVQAHEIAHLKLGHTMDNRDETFTDYYAILYLAEKGHTGAAKLGIKQFKYRNGVTFKEYRKMVDAKK